MKVRQRIGQVYAEYTQEPPRIWSLWTRAERKLPQSESITGRADTFGRGGSAAHMVAMTRRSDLAEGRADTLGRGGSAAHMVAMARRSDPAEGPADT